jgi:GT2 family glycosyltransferase
VRNYCARVVDPDSVASSAPAVVAVVVAHDPGEWFQATLTALAAQDHPNLRVVVVDTGSRESRDDLASQVAAAIPDATVHRLDHDVGFGAAANEVLALPETTAGAEFFLFCHDDVAPEPGAVRALVATASDSGAGVVGPKLVGWDDPQHLLHMGAVVDKAGFAMPMVERGELDQGQHDGVREVFEVVGAFTLVRADLFGLIGGFDEGISLLADDLSLCWRARVAGAPVVTSSEARVRHREALAERLPVKLRRRLAIRHRLRVVLTSYERWHLLRVLPQLLLLSLVTMVLGVLAWKPSRAVAEARSWWWNLRRGRSLWLARRHVRRFRRVRDRELRRLQVPGLIHPLLLVQRAGVGSGSRRRAVRDRVEAWCAGWTRGGVAVLLVLAAVLLMGSRHLLTRGVPAVGDFASFGRPGDLIEQWLSGWRPAGLGTEAAAPAALGALGALGTVLLGHMGVVRILVTVGLILLGVVGVARLLRPSGSRWAPVGAAVAYAAVPVPYTALANGRWAPLAVYAAAPAVLGGLVRASGAAPFYEGSALGTVVVTGIVTGLLAMVVPAAGLLVLFLAVGVALGWVLAFDLRGALRVMRVALGSVLLATLLQLPWAFEVAGAWRSAGAWVGDPRSGGEVDLPALLGFGASALPGRAWSWGLLVAAGMAVLAGRGWRSTWAVRAWVIAIGAWAMAAVASGAVDRDVPLPDPAVFLVCAGLALAFAVGMGVAAIEARAGHLRFGRTASALTMLGLLAATVPVLRASLDGYWLMPRGDFSEVLGFLDRPATSAPSSSRVLWLGDLEVLPTPSWSVGSDGVEQHRAPIGFATTEGLPTLHDLWPGPGDQAIDRIAEAVDLATSQQTARLGRLLAPMAIDYVVVPQRRAPSPFTEREWRAPPELVEALAGQLDLRRVDVDPALLVFRNLSALPGRAALREPEVLDATTPSMLLEAGQSPGDAWPVLGDGDGYGQWAGRLPAGVTVFQSVSGSDRWVLEVDGARVPRTAAFGWANAFDVREGGSAVLRYDTPVSYHLLLGGQVALWLAALAMAIRLRQAKRRAEGTSLAVAEPLTVAVAVSATATDPVPASAAAAKAAKDADTGTGVGRDVDGVDPETETERPVVVESVKVITASKVESDAGAAS